MEESRIWWAYLSTLIECFDFNSIYSETILENFKSFSKELMMKLDDEEIKYLTRNHLRNKPNFKKAFRHGIQIWSDLRRWLIEGDREAIVKTKVGLRMKGASLAIRKLGHNVAVLDVLVLRKEFNLNSKEIKRVQSSIKKYLEYEEKLRMRYPDLISWDITFWEKNSMNGRRVIELDDLFLEEIK